MSDAPLRRRAEDLLAEWREEVKEHGIWTSGHSVANKMASVLAALLSPVEGRQWPPHGSSDAPCVNTDRELWREREGDYYADSLHVTEQGGIGINRGGRVIVLPLWRWHELAMNEFGGIFTPLEPATSQNAGATKEEGSQAAGAQDSSSRPSSLILPRHGGETSAETRAHLQVGGQDEASANATSATTPDSHERGHEADAAGLPEVPAQEHPAPDSATGRDDSHVPLLQSGVVARHGGEPPAPAIERAARFVYDNFVRDEADGYRSRDRQFAIEVLGKAFSEARADTGARQTQPDPPHVREDYREVWLSGWRAGAEAGVRQTSHRPFRELREQMSPKAQAEAKKRTKDTLREIEAARPILDDLACCTMCGTMKHISTGSVCARCLP
jgi:hypothetical protein